MQTFFNSLAGIVLLLCIYVSFKTSILKDSDLGKPTSGSKMFSFARTQGMWWTTIIVCCFIVGCGLDSSKHIMPLNSTCLILLSIGIGTTVMGRVIDNTDKDNNVIRFQDSSPSGGFFKDILRDGQSGITVHRFQALIFNFIFGIIFTISFFEKGVFPDFDELTLGVLGISAATYLSMKATENQKA